MTNNAQKQLTAAQRRTVILLQKRGYASVGEFGLTERTARCLARFGLVEIEERVFGPGQVWLTEEGKKWSPAQ